MSELREKLLSEPTHGQLTAACVDLVEDHIRQRRGWKGTAMRAGLALLNSVRDDAVRLGVERLLPEFVDTLAPHYRRWLREHDEPFSEYLLANADQVADALVRVADQRVASSGNAGVRTAYQALRRFAHDEVGNTLPRVGHLIEQHAG